MIKKLSLKSLLLSLLAILAVPGIIQAAAVEVKQAHFAKAVKAEAAATQAEKVLANKTPEQQLAEGSIRLCESIWSGAAKFELYNTGSNEFIGYISCTIYRDYDPGTGEQLKEAAVISQLGIEADYQNKHYGSFLFERACNYFKQRGYTEVYWFADPTPTVQDMRYEQAYKKAGFIYDKSWIAGERLRRFYMRCGGKLLGVYGGYMARCLDDKSPKFAQFEKLHQKALRDRHEIVEMNRQHTRWVVMREPLAKDAEPTERMQQTAAKKQMKAGLRTGKIA
jgi:GNAT superfamily N-acetyltransferase